MLQPKVKEGVFQNCLFSFDFPYDIDERKSEAAHLHIIFFFTINNNYFRRYLKKGYNTKMTKRHILHGYILISRRKQVYEG